MHRSLTSRTRIHSLFALLFLATGACGASEASFEPTEHVAASGHAGQPAASYDVRTGAGPIAHVNVWSQGAYRDNRDRPIVHLTLEVRNLGREPIRLGRDLLRLEPFATSGAPLAAARLLAVQSDEGRDAETVPPASASTIQVWFALPPATRPSKLGGLRVRWGLAFEDGRHYVQFTDFQRTAEPGYAAGVVYYDPIFGFYDPFLYGRPYVVYHYHVPVRRVMVRRHGRHG